uniref:ABC-type xenobiotic transporter n=1 Tax=Timema californicum TaxID=61474 RepID=A0A7R9J2X6_TIMCA|nr:unnamed protein product [Timema californicum]
MKMKLLLQRKKGVHWSRECQKFTKPEKDSSDDSAPPVAFFKLFRFSTASEKFILFIGLISGIACGLCTPANSLLYGDLTGSMVNFGTYAGIASMNESATIPPEVVQEFVDAIVRFAIGISCVGAVMLVCTYISITTFNYAAQKQIFRIRSLFLQSALLQDIGWYDLNQTGDFASRMTEDLNKLEEGIGEKVAMCEFYLVAFISSITLAFIKGWELTLICLVSLPITLLFVGITTRIASALSRKELEVYGQAGSIAEEVLSSIRTVVAFGGESKEVDRYQVNLGAAKDNNIKRGFFTGLGFGGLWFCIYSNYAFSFWYAVGLVIESKYDVSTMFTVFFSVMMASMNIGMSSPYFETFSISKGAAAKVFSLIDRISPINSMSPDGKHPSSINGSIEFKNIHFKYPSRPDVKVLQGLNLTISPGETVALVGSSGCGKSTCVQLIQRFYDPIQGSIIMFQISLDGEDIKNLNVAWLRSNIGVVGQEPILFQTTIAENIRFGNEQASMDEIIHSAKEANAHDFVSKLPQGYDTLVGERGAQLSGGQKQRIAIARALVRNPHILLLDEATSALDTSSEAKVQAALDKASTGRTTIIVAHRLSTIRQADKIVALSDGQVAEQGTHEQLMALKGQYHNLVMAQVNMVGRPRHLSVTSDKSVEEDDIRSITKSFVPEEKEQEEKSSMMEVLRLNKQEWPYIMIGCICSIIMGCAFPIFAVLFGEILGVSILRWFHGHCILSKALLDLKNKHARIFLSLDDASEIRSKTNIYCLYFVIAGIIVGLATFTQIYTFTLAGEKLTMRLRKLLFQAMVHQEIAWFDEGNNNTGALCAKLSGDTSSVQGATGQRLGTIFSSFSTLVLGLTLSLYYEWRLGLATLAFAPIILISHYLFQFMIKNGQQANQETLEKATKLAVEAVGNIRTVAGLGREKAFHDDYRKELLPGLKLGLRNTHFRGIVFAIARSISFFAFAACMYYGGQLVKDGDMPYANVFKKNHPPVHPTKIRTSISTSSAVELNTTSAVANALIMGTSSIANAIAFAPNFEKGLAAAGRIFKLLGRKPKIMDPNSYTMEKWVTSGNVEYSRVEFSYPTRENTRVLRGLNLEVRQGQTVALVGPSGCGKSTCIQLLERFYDPMSGSVSLDERDISSLTMSSLRSQLGIVSQEPVLFDRTIADNIAYGDNNREVSMDEIIQAAKEANIHTFISSLPLGYETRMGEKGAQLSGGQKQRVAIARALIRNPKILLLDEATSALDTESEKVVQEALDKAKEGRTCITIAHRLSTIQDADVICVIDKGVVSELGTHSQLLSQRGIYYKLHKLQGGAR